MQDTLTLANELINKTNKHVFLTGKAGTGKTTFLRNLAKTTYKNYAIVAPTGIAALNAKGVTIHSQFLFPLGSYIPVNEPAGKFGEDVKVFTSYSLSRRHPLNAERRQVLRQIELLIIDEVSMLRADLLDAIDHRLRSLKQNYNTPFGGVQLLLIGDLFQLPPIVNDQEWHLLKLYYSSAFFFESIALKQAGFVFVELTKIFRQEDEAFIRVLNHLRDNAPTAEDITLLNEHFNPEPSKEDIITLTTHNKTAHEINDSSLSSLKGSSVSFSAEIKDEFPPSMFPVDEEITLKKGAQVMFIKNDTQDGAYFNGKLAQVSVLKKDEIKVRFTDTRKEFTLRKETWENKKYTVNPDTKEIEEEVIGSFSHYPIRLAWAITVHKSQGLTFEKAIIDVGRAFAPGQVYVALSRLKSLEGLILKSRIPEKGIQNDRNVEAFSASTKQQPALDDLLKNGQSHFIQQLIHSTFDFTSILQHIHRITKGKASEKIALDDDRLGTISNLFNKEHANTQTYRKQLLQLVGAQDWSKLEERIVAGSAYYQKHMRSSAKTLLEHIAEAKKKTRTKTYVNELLELDQLILNQWKAIKRMSYLIGQIVAHEVINIKDAGLQSLMQEREQMILAINLDLKAPPKKASKGTKPQKGETHKKTLALFKEGKTIDQTAEARGLSNGTIESHAAILIEEEKIDISTFLSKEEVQSVLKVLETQDVKTTTDAVKALDHNFSYGQVRMVQAYLKLGSK